jgi:hypothetical protein
MVKQCVMLVIVVSNADIKLVNGIKIQLITYHQLLRTINQRKTLGCIFNYITTSFQLLIVPKGKAHCVAIY